MQRTHLSDLNSAQSPMPDRVTRLLLLNVPVDCSEDIVKKWIEDRGYGVLSVRLIHDVISGTSPSFAHVHLRASCELDKAQQTLSGQILRGRVIDVRRVVVPHALADAVVSTGTHSSPGASA